MNTPKVSDGDKETTWVGVAYVVPKEGSFQERKGLLGGYAFVAFRKLSLDEGIKCLASELDEGGTKLVGFEWLNRIEDNEKELTDADHELMDKLLLYPVQFHDIHWFNEEG